MCRKQTSDPDAWLLSELNGVVSTVMQASCLADDAKMRNASCKVYTGTAYFKPSALPWCTPTLAGYERQTHVSRKTATKRRNI